MGSPDDNSPHGSHSPPVRLCPIYLHCHRRLICAISDNTNTIVSQAESISSASNGRQTAEPEAICESPAQPFERQISLLLVARPTLFRTAVRMLLGTHPGINVIGETVDLTSALGIADREQPDIILFEPPPRLNDSFDSLLQLCGDSHKRRVIILTHQSQPHHTLADELMRLGVSGILFENTTPLVLFKAIERVHAGEVWFERRMMAHALSRRSGGTNDREIESRINSLTQREREVITLVSQGLKNKQVADRLFISHTTVHHHLSSVFAKLGVSDRLELVIYAYRQGLVQLP